MGRTVQNSILKGRQLDCMELVKQGLTSKEVARTLGISPRTVDQHIAAAIENLGVNNRLAAVSRLHALERAKLLEAPPPPFMLSYTDTTADYLHDTPIRGANDDDDQEDLHHAAMWPILPPIGGSRNTLPREIRVLLIARIAVFSIMLTCLVILSVLGVVEMVSRSSS